MFCLVLIDVETNTFSKCLCYSRDTLHYKFSLVLARNRLLLAGWKVHPLFFASCQDATLVDTSHYVKELYVTSWIIWLSIQHHVGSDNFRWVTLCKNYFFRFSLVYWALEKSANRKNSFQFTRTRIFSISSGIQLSIMAFKLSTEKQVQVVN